MYPLHCFSPYNKGKACSRDSVSHSCNSLILREKTVYPYTLFPLIIREKTVYPYTLFPLIIREKTVYPYTLFPLILRGKTVHPYTLLMHTLNCLLNCNLGTTASQEGLHLEVSSSFTRCLQKLHLASCYVEIGAISPLFRLLPFCK